MRLNSLFAGSTEGAPSLATILGIVATCHKLGGDPEGYLALAFERQVTSKEPHKMSAAELTPAAYKRSLAEQRRAA